MSIKKITLLILAACLCIAIVMLNFSSQASSEKKSTITIGSKDFTESIVLAHIMADIIEEETNLSVTRKTNLGGSNIAMKGLLTKEIHIYPEYTAAILYNLYPEKTPSSTPPMERIRKSLDGDSLELTNLFGFSNNYVLAVKKETSEKYNLKTVQDLMGISDNMTLASDFEFIDRPDGYKNLIKKSKLRFKSIKGMNRGIMYRSIQQDAVAVICSYTTEGQVQTNNLIVLEDDQNFFFNYEAGALVHQDILKSYPEIRSALAKLEGQISEKDMRDMNVKVELEGLKAQKVAHDFLKAKGLVK